MSRRKKLCVFTLIVIGFLFPICDQLNYYFGVPITLEGRQLREAKAAYESSRGPDHPPVGSDRFLAFSLCAGMSENEVLERLPRPENQVVHLVAQAGEEWSGFANRYEYSYRPETVRGSESVPPALGIEILYVYFDAQGAARKVRLLHFGRIFDFSKKDYMIVLP